MIHVFGYLGQPKQACPQSVVVTDLDKPSPLPGVTAPADAEKDPEIKPIEQTSAFKWVVGGLVVYGGLKAFGWL